MHHHRLRRMLHQIEKIEGENNRYARIEAEEALRKIRDQYQPPKEAPQQHVS